MGQKKAEEANRSGKKSYSSPSLSSGSASEVGLDSLPRSADFSDDGRRSEGKSFQGQDFVYESGRSGSGGLCRCEASCTDSKASGAHMGPGSTHELHATHVGCLARMVAQGTVSIDRGQSSVAVARVYVYRGHGLIAQRGFLVEVRALEKLDGLQPETERQEYAGPTLAGGFLRPCPKVREGPERPGWDQK